jgi:hypothetical protein
MLAGLLAMVAGCVALLCMLAACLCMPIIQASWVAVLVTLSGWL